MKSDALGDRIKSYEIAETGLKFINGLPIVVRLDGKSFHSFTKNMKKPYDQDMMDLMDDTTKYLLEESGAIIAYTQSDEISLILFPWLKNNEADLPFGGKKFKIISVLASTATARFLKGALELFPDACARGLPRFDCRAFQVPSKEEAIESLRWRAKDSLKNSVSMAARSHFSHKSLQNKTSSEMQEMLFQEKNINFNNYPVRFKEGSFFKRKSIEVYLSEEELNKIPEDRRPVGPVIRSCISIVDNPLKNKNVVDIVFETGI